MKQHQGTVKWFSNSKGYGFISPDDGGQEVFVHHKHIEMDGFRRLEEGQRVSFLIVDVGRGPQAQKVRPLRSQVAIATEDELPEPKYTDWRI